MNLQIFIMGIGEGMELIIIEAAFEDLLDMI